MHRQNELEARINIFVAKCEQATKEIRKLESQAQSFVQQLNCDPSLLKDRFLNSMKRLDEYMYLITDFNIAITKLDETSNNSPQCTPVHDNFNKPLLPTPTFNLMDILSEPLRSTSTTCSNNFPPEKQISRKIPKVEQTLISFSSGSCSAESVPEVKPEIKETKVDHEKPKVEKEVQCNINSETKQTVQDESPQDNSEAFSLPAQTLLQVDHNYPATIMNVDGDSLWIVTDDLNDACRLMMDMTAHYKGLVDPVQIKPEDTATLTYCAYYDDETDCYYRALFINLTEDDIFAELFLMDTGELRISKLSNIQPLAEKFYEKPPFARCCHLAGVEPLSSYQDKKLELKLEEVMKKYIGQHCTVEVDDNTSESLGVYIRLSGKETLNNILLKEEDAIMRKKADNRSVATSQPVHQRPSMNRGPSLHQGESVNKGQSMNQGSPLHQSTSVNRGFPVHQGASVNQIPSVNRGVPVNHQCPSGHRGTPVQHDPPVHQGPPEILEKDLDITECREFEDPVEAVTGYHNRDEADICKHYKGSREKTCFKGAMCKKKHILKHPDGWTMDRVEVPVILESVPLPEPDSWHKVHITCVCHFDMVYVQFIKEKAKDEVADFGIVQPPNSLDALVRDMNSPAAKMSYKPLKICPAPGELVAAIYPLDDQWYRARVIESTRPDQCVQVLYIDYGNMMWVKEDCVRALEPRFLMLPAQGVRCKLAGVAALTHCSKQWATAKRCLTDMLQDRILDLHVIARGYDEIDVEIFDQDGYSIADQLAASNMVKLQKYSVEEDSKARHKLVVP